MKVDDTPQGMRVYSDDVVNRDAKTKVWGVAGYGATVLRLMEAAEADGDTTDVLGSELNHRKKPMT